jgi:hypothetical protein
LGVATPTSAGQQGNGEQFKSSGPTNLPPSKSSDMRAGLANQVLLQQDGESAITMLSFTGSLKLQRVWYQLALETTDEGNQ